MRRPVARRCSDRVVLLGDAAGYVDAITGEGHSLAFDAAAALARRLPEALKRGASAVSLSGYEQDCNRMFWRYEKLAGLLVWTARHPALRSLVIDTLSVIPPAFGAALRLALPSPSDLACDLTPRKTPGTPRARPSPPPPASCCAPLSSATPARSSATALRR